MQERARFGLYTESAVYNVSDNFSPAGSKKGITQSVRTLHIMSQKRLMVSYALFPLIMWQAATPMSCAH